MLPTVESVMSRKVLTIARDRPIAEAAELLDRRHIGGLVVIDDDGKPIGVVSLTDLVDPARVTEGHPMSYEHDAADPPAAAAIAGRATVRVADVMSPFIVAIEAGASIAAAARLMLTDDIHRLVVTRGGRMIGIVTTTDLLRGFLEANAQPAPRPAPRA